MKINKLYLALGLGAGAAALAAAYTLRVSIPKGAKAVQPFDKDKYLGQWYEIARMDFKYEKNLDNVSANYSLNDNGTIRVDNKGYDYLKSKWKESIGKAKFVNESGVGRLKVSFFGSFYAGYNVIAIDENYQHALVVGNNLDYMWILSRDTTIPESIKNDYLKTAEELGYDTQDLIWTRHNQQ